MNLILIPTRESELRINRIVAIMKSRHIDAILLTSTTNLYYLTGRVFAGYVYITSDCRVKYFVKRPVEMDGKEIEYIRKPEQIPALLSTMPESLGLEIESLPYLDTERIKACFPPRCSLHNASAVMREARKIKTPYEIEKIRFSASKHDLVYGMIPRLYSPGMTDFELQLQIEQVMRREGCLGQLRVNGSSMEIHMGNLTAGDNADNPSPYDFTMGGAGMDPSLPVGADGSILHRGQTVMADMNGNFNGYMTDMSRTFSIGAISDLAHTAHNCSVAICREAEKAMKAGAEIKALYDLAFDMVKDHSLQSYFMGHKQQAPFIGHGIGIEINEIPVITARSNGVFEEHMVIALEPKFVIPHVGAVGIENTYLVGQEGSTSFNHAPVEIIEFE